MNKTWSVGEVNRFIGNLIGQEYLLRNIQVSGEVSNCKYHTSGHIYFFPEGQGRCDPLRDVCRTAQRACFPAGGRRQSVVVTELCERI